jgi:hypothetical protein
VRAWQDARVPAHEGDLRPKPHATQPLMDPYRNRDTLTTLAEMLWGYYLGLSGQLGLDRNQVTDMDETPPDESGDVLITWWALADQGPPSLGLEIGPHQQLAGSPVQWTGRVKLNASEIGGLRPSLGPIPTQDDADYFDAGEPDEDEVP